MDITGQDGGLWALDSDSDSDSMIVTVTLTLTLTVDTDSLYLILDTLSMPGMNCCAMVWCDVLCVLTYEYDMLNSDSQVLKFSSSQVRKFASLQVRQFSNPQQ